MEREGKERGFLGIRGEKEELTVLLGREGKKRKESMRNKSVGGKCLGAICAGINVMLFALVFHCL